MTTLQFESFSLFLTIKPARTRRTSNWRSASGSSLAELPAALWILLVGLLVPMIILAMLSLKASFFNTVAKDAAHNASRAKIFKYPSDPPPGSPKDAVTIARDTAMAAAQALGVKIDSADNIKTVIVETELAPPYTSTVHEDMLATVSPSDHLYSVRVTVQGSVEPLLR